MRDLKIADALGSVTYADGEVVVRQGDVGDAFSRECIEQ